MSDRDELQYGPNCVKAGLSSEVTNRAFLPLLLHHLRCCSPAAQDPLHQVKTWNSVLMNSFGWLAGSGVAAGRADHSRVGLDLDAHVFALPMTLYCIDVCF